MCKLKNMLHNLIVTSEKKIECDWKSSSSKGQEKIQAEMKKMEQIESSDGAKESEREKGKEPNEMKIKLDGKGASMR